MRYSLAFAAAVLLAVLACGGGSEEPPETASEDAAVAESAQAVEPPELEPQELAEEPAEAAEPTGGPGGSWSMTLGEMTLAVNGDSVTGDYPLGTLRGTVDDRVVSFEYVEGSITGTGMMQFDGAFESFTGWQVMGQDTLEWSGERL